MLPPSAPRARLLPIILIIGLVGCLTGLAPARAQAPSITFSPVADAYVDAGRPTAPLGTVTILRTYASPEQRSYLRFVVTGLSGQAVTRATLRLYANGSSTAGFAVSGVPDTAWSETGITYSNMPALGAPIASHGEHGGARYVSVDVTP